MTRGKIKGQAHAETDLRTWLRAKIAKPTDEGGWNSVEIASALDDLIDHTADELLNDIFGLEFRTATAAEAEPPLTAEDIRWALDSLAYAATTRAEEALIAYLTARYTTVLKTILASDS